MSSSNVEYWFAASERHQGTGVVNYSDGLPVSSFLLDETRSPRLELLVRALPELPLDDQTATRAIERNTRFSALASPSKAFSKTDLEYKQLKLTPVGRLFLSRFSRHRCTCPTLRRSGQRIHVYSRNSSRIAAALRHISKLPGCCNALFSFHRLILEVVVERRTTQYRQNRLFGERCLL